MLKAFVEKIQSMSFQAVERDGRVLTNQDMTPIRDAQPDTLKVRTLEGIIDYIRNENMNTDDVFIHIADHKTVYLCGKLYGPEKQRDTYVCASAYEIGNQFGSNLKLGDFLTYIQSGFVQDENTAAILRALGNIVDETCVEYADDGMTQRVTARTGITRREIINLPNPVILRPYRTFPDVEQPVSPFVLRVDKIGESIVCLLKETDGGAWRNAAVAAIKEYYMSEEIYDGLRLKVVG